VRDELLTRRDIAEQLLSWR